MLRKENVIRHNLLIALEQLVMSFLWIVKEHPNFSLGPLTAVKTKLSINTFQEITLKLVIVVISKVDTSPSHNHR